MSHEEGQLASALARCRMGKNSYDRQFARDIAALSHQAPQTELTVQQRGHLIRLVIRNRRQISAEVVNLAKRMQVADAR